MDKIALLTNAFKLFDIDSSKELAGVVTVELPEQSLATEEYGGAGVAGKINVPMHANMSAQTVTISCPQIYGQAVAYMKLGTTKTLDLRADISRLNPDTHIVERMPYRVVMKGPITSVSPGKVEQGSAADCSIKMEVYYIHSWLDGAETLEWDVAKYIYKVDGEDLLAETRKNILA